MKTKKFRSDYQGDLSESLQEAQIDREKNIIRNVQIIREQSKNGRVYTDAAIDGVISLADGIPVYSNHGTHTEFQEHEGVRDVNKLLGVIRNPSRNGKRGVAEFHVSPDKAERIFWIAENRPHGVGLSLVSPSGAYKMSKGKAGAPDIVESISSLDSIDLVSKAGMATSLFESETIDAVESGTEAAETNKLKEQQMEELEKVKGQLTEMQSKLAVMEADALLVSKERDELKKYKADLEEKATRRTEVIKWFDDEKIEKDNSLIESLSGVTELDTRKSIFQAFVNGLKESAKHKSRTDNVPLTERGAGSKEAADKSFAALGL